MELNAVKKDFRKVDLRIALVYPNLYKAGMSSLAIHLIYMLFNSFENILCERVFLDYPNSLESNQSLSNFDVVGFSLQFETDYVNLVKILSRSGIPLKSKDRDGKFPLIMAGGPCAAENPAPISDFVDFFVVGELEAIAEELIHSLIEIRRGWLHLSDLTDIKGIYVPLYTDKKVSRVWVDNLNESFYPVRQIIPQLDAQSKYYPAFGKAFLLETSRGCYRCCNFCLIGCQFAPYRERSLHKLEDIVREGIAVNNVNKIASIASAFSDYQYLEDLCEYIVNLNLELAIPSIRADKVNEQLVRLLVKGNAKTLTLAPETASEKMVKLINKGIEAEDTLNAVKCALENGIRNIKLYFIIGLPNESLDDVVEIPKLVEKMMELKPSPKVIRLSVNPFVPKPHTPFQFAPQMSVEELKKRLKIIYKGLKHYGRRVEVESLDPRWAKIQAVLSLGGRELGELICEVASRDGGLTGWLNIFKKLGPLDEYIRVLQANPPFPWEVIESFMGRSRLYAIFKNAVDGG